MAKAESPPRFNRGHFYDPNFTAEITAKMQVPKRIRVTGVVDDDEDDDFDRRMNWQPEKIDMRVPDRILVTGTNHKFVLSLVQIERFYRDVFNRRRWSYRNPSYS